MSDGDQPIFERKRTVESTLETGHLYRSKEQSSICDNMVMLTGDALSREPTDCDGIDARELDDASKRKWSILNNPPIIRQLHTPNCSCPDSAAHTKGECDE